MSQDPRAIAATPTSQRRAEAEAIYQYLRLISKGVNKWVRYETKEKKT